MCCPRLVEARPHLRVAIAWAMALGFLGLSAPRAGAHGSHTGVHGFQAGAADPDVEHRIGFYSNKLSEHPNLYAVYPQLAAAYLDKARESRDVSWLVRACSALRRSIEIQPNLQAFKTLAAVNNFAHEFDVALAWARRAAEVEPRDPETVALMVEAYLGLGRLEEASEWLPPLGTPAIDFHSAAARGLWLAAQARSDESAAGFLEAAELARASGADDLMAWARGRAASVGIGAGREVPDPLHAALETLPACIAPVPSVPAATRWRREESRNQEK